MVNGQRVVCYREWESPAGKLLLAADEKHLFICDWVGGWHRASTERRFQGLYPHRVVWESNGVIERCIGQLGAYFSGQRKAFDLPLRLTGSAFQIRVWKALQAIPYGGTISYGELALELGMPQGARAVANAVGANPCSIVIPCHRVLGAHGALGGYGGGLAAKKFLLALEKSDGL